MPIVKASELAKRLEDSVLILKLDIESKIEKALDKLEYRVDNNYSISIFNVPMNHEGMVQKILAEAGFNVTRISQSGRQGENDMFIKFTLPPQGE